MPTRLLHECRRTAARNPPAPDIRRHATLPQSWIQRENWEFETHRAGHTAALRPGGRDPRTARPTVGPRRATPPPQPHPRTCPRKPPTPPRVAPGAGTGRARLGWGPTSAYEARRQAPRNVVSILDSARELGIRDAQAVCSTWFVMRHGQGIDGSRRERAGTVRQRPPWAWWSERRPRCLMHSGPRAARRLQRRARQPFRTQHLGCLLLRKYHAIP